MNEEQQIVIRCAFADLIGAVQAYRQSGSGDSAHNWGAHIQTIEELKATFPFLDEIPEDIYNEEE
jgi:hypothetical protein